MELSPPVAGHYTVTGEAWDFLIFLAITLDHEFYWMSAVDNDTHFGGVSNTNNQFSADTNWVSYKSIRF